MESLSKKYGIPEIQIEEFAIELKIIELVPPHIAKKLRVVPMNVDQSNLILAMENPNDLSAIELVKMITGYCVEPVVAARSSIENALEDYYIGQYLH